MSDKDKALHDKLDAMSFDENLEDAFDKMSETQALEYAKKVLKHHGYIVKAPDADWQVHKVVVTLPVKGNVTETQWLGAVDKVIQYAFSTKSSVEKVLDTSIEAVGQITVKRMTRVAGGLKRIGQEVKEEE